MHYELCGMAWLWLPRNYKLDPEKLKKWWSCGSTWVESCCSPSAWYKYITKFDNTKKLPKGMRLFGCGGLDDEGKAEVARASLPRWLAALLPEGHRARRMVGGGWVDLESGEFFMCPFTWSPWGVKLASIPPETWRGSSSEEVKPIMASEN